MAPLDRELCLRLASEVRSRIEDCAGECHSAALALCFLLTNAGFIPHLIEGRVNQRMHWWVQVQGFLLDVTCDQFNEQDGEFPKLLFCPVEDAEAHVKVKRHSIDFENTLYYIGSGI